MRGLYVESTGNADGRPQRVWIRGVNTLGNNDPLYIVDGVPTTNSFVFQTLNPASVESIQVLKDAAASSIYGSRAANGVIIVTTKQGSREKINIDITSSVKMNSWGRQEDEVMTSLQLGEARWLGAVNDGTDPVTLNANFLYDWNGDFNNPVLNNVTLVTPVGGDPNFPAANTRWWEHLVRKESWVFSNELAISGSTENSNMLLNLAHYADNGQYIFTGYKRIQARLNLSTNFADDKITVGTNLMVMRSERKQDAERTFGIARNALSGFGDQVGYAGRHFLAPTFPAYGLDGTPGGPIGAGYTDAASGLVTAFYGKWDRYNQVATFGNVYLDIKPIENLVLRTSYGLDYNHFKEKNIDPIWQNGFMSNDVNSLDIFTTDDVRRTWSTTANYTLNAGPNRVNFLAGVEAIWNDFDTYYVGRRDFAVNDQEEFYILSAATGETQSNQLTTGHGLLSYFGKINYAFSNRYLAAVTIRRDGSSRFGTENQYGTFPAVSVGWRINNEQFFQSNFVSDLKLRVSWGQVGNQEIGDKARFALYETRYGYLFNNGVGFPGFWTPHGTAYDLEGNDGGNLPSGFVSVQAGNDELKWETTEEINIGLDFAFLDDRLHGAFDYFTRETTDILIRPPIASAVGEGKLQWLNGATKENKGFELVLGWRDEKGDFSYSILGNVARFKDKITELPEEVRTAYPGNAEQDILGHSELSYFGYRTDGLFQSQAEVDAHATQIGAGPGRLRYADLNSDGVINALDQEYFGTSLPDFVYGLQLDFIYKNFDLQIFGTGVQGRSGPHGSITCNFQTVSSGLNSCPGLLDGWTPQNPNSTQPRPTLVDANRERRSSDYIVRNLTYFKLRQLQFGYTLPRELLSSIRVDRLRFFLVAENLFWIDDKDFPGPDAEQAAGGGMKPSSIALGLNLTFN